MCLGNNDWPSDYGPMVKERKIFLGSGLKWQVAHYRRRLNLTMSDIAICGHTHTPYMERDEWTGTLVMNPGSPTYPRRSKPSMGRIIVEDGSSRTARCSRRPSSRWSSEKDLSPGLCRADSPRVADRPPRRAAPRTSRRRTATRERRKSPRARPRRSGRPGRCGSRPPSL